jgi:hypothetical protein
MDGWMDGCQLDLGEVWYLVRDKGWWNSRDGFGDYLAYGRYLGKDIAIVDRW